MRRARHLFPSRSRKLTSEARRGLGGMSYFSGIFVRRLTPKEIDEFQAQIEAIRSGTVRPYGKIVLKELPQYSQISASARITVSARSSATLNVPARGRPSTGAGVPGSP